MGDPRPGYFIPGSIESAVSGGVAIHQLGPWSASVFLRYFGPRPLTEDDSVRSTASMLVNAQLSCRVAKPLLVTVDVFNVLDAQVDDVAYDYPSLLRGEKAPANICPPTTHPRRAASLTRTSTRRRSAA